MRWVEINLERDMGVTDGIKCSVCGNVEFEKMYIPNGFTDEQWDLIEKLFGSPETFWICKKCLEPGFQYMDHWLLCTKDDGWLERYDQFRKKVAPIMQNKEGGD